MTEVKIQAFSPANVKKYLGDSFQSNYIIKYLSELGAKTFVVEEKYIDRDYMIDYQKFYSRSFKEISKFTNRLHFFSLDFSKEDFYMSLEKNEVDDLKKSYLGFVVVRPIKSFGQPLIGRSILKTYPKEDNNEKRFFVTAKYTASLFGVSLEIHSIPFQEQDQGVSACATIALWSALNPISKIFGTVRHSPAEITEVATTFPDLIRVFPSNGLSLQQMINYIRSVGLDIEVIKTEDNSMITTAIKAYINAGLPLIATLIMKGKEGKDYHAVTISGYRCDCERNVKEIYVHDDQIGPYSRVKPVNNSFCQWEYEWLEMGYKTIKLDKLLVPIYPKIRLTFPKIYAYYKKLKEEIEEDIGEINIELFLTWIEKYKEYLLNKNFVNKVDILTKSMPKYMWVIRAYRKGRTLFDWIFDGTSTYPENILDIEYI